MYLVQSSYHRILTNWCCRLWIRTMTATFLKQNSQISPRLFLKKRFSYNADETLAI